MIFYDIVLFRNDNMLRTAAVAYYVLVRNKEHKVANKELKMRQFKSLPKNQDYRIGYSQAIDDLSYAIRDYFENEYLHSPDKPELREDPVNKFFLNSVRDLSNLLRDEQKKAQERARSLK